MQTLILDSEEERINIEWLPEAIEKLYFESVEQGKRIDRTRNEIERTSGRIKGDASMEEFLRSHSETMKRLDKLIVKMERYCRRRAKNSRKKDA